MWPLVSQHTMCTEWNDWSWKVKSLISEYLCEMTETFWALLHAQYPSGIFQLKQEECSAHPTQFGYNCRTKSVTDQRGGSHTDIIYKLFVVKANLAMNLFDLLQQQLGRVYRYILFQNLPCMSINVMAIWWVVDVYFISNIMMHPFTGWALWI